MEFGGSVGILYFRGRKVVSKIFGGSEIFREFSGTF